MQIAIRELRVLAAALLSLGVAGDGALANAADESIVSPAGTGCGARAS
jgi:hypothetical protein